MIMERVTFGEAKWLKERGFFQDTIGSMWYDEDGTLLRFKPKGKSWIAPTYYEVWEWLASKGIFIDVDHYYAAQWVADYEDKLFSEATQEKVLKRCINYIMMKK